jgi:hypothetical protein
MNRQMMQTRMVEMNENKRSKNVNLKAKEGRMEGSKHKKKQTK